MGNPAECRINSLPESIFHHILCLLPIKAAVRCSILSKRWRYLYTSIPTVKFDEDDFREAVEQVTTPASRFSLDMTLGTEAEKRQFGRWLRHLAVGKKVQELSLSVDTADKSDKAYVLPLNLLDCSSIHHLGMVACNFECRKDGLPMFANVKSRSLGSAAFANDKICKLIREFPQLDSLTIENCLGMTDNTHTIATNIRVAHSCGAGTIECQHKAYTKLVEEIELKRRPSAFGKKKASCSAARKQRDPEKRALKHSLYV
ncbi:F-box protein [Nymphaea thermarum]|nr:F-box protein [Nymphaea thermarum]